MPAKPPLAVVGLDCRFPGADDIASYWSLIRRAEIAIGELPEERLNRRLYYAEQKGVLGRTYATKGGVVRERAFNRHGFDISEHLIRRADPVHLGMLDVALGAFSSASLTREDLSSSRTGVFIGHSRGSLLAGELLFSAHAEEIAGYLQSVASEARSNIPLSNITRDFASRLRRLYPSRHDRGNPFVRANDVAATIARGVGLDGPYMAIDAACASSLYALSTASNLLQSGQIDLALVGGAAFSSWQSLILFSSAHALSNGESCPFDERAGGFVSSDGFAALVLKALPRAVADCDTIWGVIRSTGLASDGKGKSLWAPDAAGQIEALRRAYESAALDPRRIQYIEAHGTSTQLGDATEIESLSTFFGAYVDPSTRIPISSVKANIGHTREAAGLAGLFKVLLMMKEGVVPKATSFVQPNSAITWQQCPFEVPIEEKVWQEDDRGQRVGAVNSFGIGGLNAHVIVESAPVTADEAFGVSTGLIASDGDHQRGDSKADEPIAIVGTGAVFPNGWNIEMLGETFRSGADVRTDAGERWNTALFGSALSGSPSDEAPRGGWIRGFEIDWRKLKIPPKQLESADPLQFLVLDSADQALRAAGYDSRRFDRMRTAVVVGTMFGGDFRAQLNIALRAPELRREAEEYLQGFSVDAETAANLVDSFESTLLSEKPMLSDETGSYTASTLASRVAKVYDLKGGAFSIDAGEASSHAAVHAAVELLRSGACDAVLCAGAQRFTDPSCYEIYTGFGVGGPDGGFVPCEGAGAMLLKRAPDAVAAGDSVLALIGAVECSTFASDLAQSSASAGGTADVAIEPSRNGNRPSHDTIRNDPAAVVPDLLYAGVSNGCSPSIDPIGQFGHALGAAGMLSILATIDSIDRMSCPVTVESGELRGLSYGVQLSPSKSPSAADVETPRVVTISATSRAGLLKQIERVQTTADAAFSMAGLSREPADSIRLSVVAGSAEELRKLLSVAGGRLESSRELGSLAEIGAFLHFAGRRPARTAYCFAGQGSQYPGMLRSLVQANGTASAKCAEADRLLLKYGLPRFSDLAWSEDSALGSDVLLTQISLLLADLVLYEVVCDCVGPPDLVTAHSYGEYPAMVAAGVWSLEQAIRVTVKRCAEIAAHDSTSGVLMATGASADVLQPLLVRHPGVFVANRNAPDQTVLGGREGDVHEFQESLRTAGFDSNILQVPRPFHTPLMADVQPGFRRVLARERLLPPAIPLFSSITNRYVADPREIRRNLVVQLTRPVDYVDLVQRLETGDVAAFVEIGPKQVLTKLHRKNTKNPLTLSVATDHPTRGSVRQLEWVRAARLAIGTSRMAHPATLEPTPMVAVAAADKTVQRPMETVIHFDATEVRRRRLRTLSEAPRSEGAPEPLSAAESPGELTAMLVGFICEQTGYPAELIELEADLEADLGIDSIKKAQLFGELAETYELPFPEGGRIPLAKYRTLHDVLDLLQQSEARDNPREPVDVASVSEVRDGSKIEANPYNSSVHEQGELKILHLSGTPFEMGVAQAQSEELRIRQIYRGFREWQSGIAANGGGSSGSISDVIRLAGDAFPNALEELEGVADAIGYSVADLVEHNIGYHELTPGCIRLTVPAAHNGSRGMIHAVNEDWPLGLALGDVLQRIVQVRHPSGGIPNILFAVPGQVGGMNGANARGLSVTSTMLLDREAYGHPAAIWMHFWLVREILERAESVPDAVEIVRRSPPAGAWSLCIAHAPTDVAHYVEYEAGAVRGNPVTSRLATANHSVFGSPTLAPPEHSIIRLARLMELIQEQPEIDPDRAQRFMRDRYDSSRGRETPFPTMNTIQRIDNQISIVMEGSSGAIYCTGGVAATTDKDHFFHVDTARLFAVSASEVRGPQAPRTIRRKIAPVQAPASTSRVDVPLLMHRHVLRSWRVPGLADTFSQTAPIDEVLVVGHSAVAEEICRNFADRGVRSRFLDCSHAVEADWEAFDWPGDGRPVRHLILATGTEDDANIQPGAARWQDRIEAGIIAPFRLCQRWVERLREAEDGLPTSLTAVTMMGGDFGLSTPLHRPECGGIVGLIKALRRELPDMVGRAIDFPEGSPPSFVAHQVASEILSGSREPEVGYLGGNRHLLDLVPEPTDSAQEIQPGQCWVVTGGARGITFEIVRSLGLKYDLQLHLVGRTTPPKLDAPPTHLSGDDVKELRRRVAADARASGRDPTEAWRQHERAREVEENLWELRHLGVRAHYYACDVTDSGALREVLDHVRSISGPIHGIIHGSGLESASRFERKELPKVRACIAAKVSGAANLMELTREDPVRHFVGFGSISGRFGGIGQTDYSLASEMLCKLIHQFRTSRPTCRAVGVHWPAWAEVGMAARPESRIAIKASGQSFMSVEEGVHHLIRELEAGGDPGEVLFADSTTIAATQTNTSELTGTSAGAAGNLALVEGFSTTPEGEICSSALLEPNADPFLLGHLFDDVPLLPAVITVEMLAEAAAIAVAIQSPTLIEDVQIVAGLNFHLATPRTVNLTALRAENGGVHARMSCDFRDRQGRVIERDRTHATACIRFGQGEPSAPVRLDPPPEWWDVTYADLDQARRERKVFHGIEMRALTHLYFKNDHGWGRIVAPPIEEIGGLRKGKWIIPAVVVDSCLVLCGVYAREVLGYAQLPRGFDSLHLGDLPKRGEVCFASMRYTGRNDNLLRFDFDVQTEGGRSVVSARGHSRILLVGQ